MDQMEGQPARSRIPLKITDRGFLYERATTGRDSTTKLEDDVKTFTSAQATYCQAARTCFLLFKANKPPLKSERKLSANRCIAQHCFGKPMGNKMSSCRFGFHCIATESLITECPKRQSHTARKPETQRSTT